MDYRRYLAILLSEAESEKHRKHIYEFHEIFKLMIEQLVPPIIEKEMVKYNLESLEGKMRAQVQEMVRTQNEKQRVNVEAYFNGRPATNANIVKGIQESFAKAMRKIGGR